MKRKKGTVGKRREQGGTGTQNRVKCPQGPRTHHTSCSLHCQASCGVQALLSVRNAVVIRAEMFNVYRYNHFPAQISLPF